ATEEADFLPDIYVELKETGDYYTLIVEDNGPGITKEEIPNVFGKLLYGSRFHKRKQSLTPEQRLLVRRDGEIEFLPIGVLCDAYLPSAGAGTAPIPDEIQVPSFNRETHEMTWEDVTHAIRHETTEQTYEITTQKGRTVEVTGNHSVFSVTKDGETKEVKAADLSSGDTILTPRQLPTPGETVDSINLLEHITLDQLDGRRVYVYGFDRETLETIRDGDTIRKKPSPDSTRERYYYRYNGVEILRDSLEQNYLDKGYLPAAKVIELGWEEKAADCTLKTYQVGGKETELPVTLPVDKSLMELLGYYVTEGHVGDRQVGFTFGSHETELITATEEAMAQLNGRTTTVERERNSTRVKAFGSPLAMALQNLCGDHARNKQVPGFVFEAPPEQQQQFLAAVYQGDGSDAYPSNQLSHTTTSETLARQLSVLWNMQGVLASTERRNDEHGYADEPTTKYRTSVYGEDVTLAGVFEQTDPTHEQEYKRIPASLLDAVRVDDCPNETVPDTIPGLLLATGIGSSLEHAAVYASLIEDALDGDVVQKPRYVTNLQEMGLLDSDHQPTDTLRELWQTVQNLQGLTETDMCLLPVKHVEETEPPEYVYDISVPGATGRDENFVVANEGALSVKNSRGQQGIGISAAVLYSQLTSGSPAKITSRTPGQSEAQYFELIIDTENNEPEIQTEDTAAWDRPHGTRIELEFEANMRARQQLHDYINHTAIVNPHARIELREPDAHMQFERATDQLPAETEEIRPHPHGVELGTVMKMLAATDSYSLSGFLQGEFTRVGKKTADGIVDAFRDRHFGREMAWTPPGPDRLGDTDLEATIRGAVANKGAEATKAFANAVVEGTDAITGVADRDRIVHHELVEIIDAAAEMIEAEYDTTFGDTVRENAVEAAWAAITTDVTPDCYTIVDEATTSRKDESVVQGLADRLADKFEQADDPRHRLTRSTIEDFVNRAADLTADREDASIGDTARGKIVAALWDRMRTVPDEAPTVRTVADDRDMAANFLEAMRS
ncbi:MAG: DNA topoisomerase VI subunit B, partial [Halobacteriales archaeon]|nr:DNA topoisomerase VI subunit B [Halobacteriales archaeon]